MWTADGRTCVGRRAPPNAAGQQQHGRGICMINAMPESSLCSRPRRREEEEEVDILASFFLLLSLSPSRSHFSRQLQLTAERRASPTSCSIWPARPRNNRGTGVKLDLWVLINLFFLSHNYYTKALQLFSPGKKEKNSKKKQNKLARLCFVSSRWDAHMQSVLVGQMQTAR